MRRKMTEEAREEEGVEMKGHEQETEEKKMEERWIVCLFVTWCFEPSQPRGITSGLNTNFTLHPSYSFHRSSYHKSCCCCCFGFFFFCCC